MRHSVLFLVAFFGCTADIQSDISSDEVFCVEQRDSELLFCCPEFAEDENDCWEEAAESACTSFIC